MSKQSLDQLIASLKSEAIAEAEKEAQEVPDNARAKAQQIIREAQAESQQILAEAEKEAADIQYKGQSALQQAARDLSIGLKNDLLDLLGVVLQQEVQKEFQPALLREAIVKVVENIGGNVALSMPEAFVAELADGIHQQLNATGQKVDIRRDQTRLQHLLVKKTDQGWSYDISPEAVSQLLRTQLSSKWTELLKKVDK
jgi:cell division septum initiation protein DivIVA